VSRPIAGLLEAQHPEFEDALRNGEQMIVGGEPFSPRLHIALHQIVASQLLVGDPPETWQTVQRLAGLGYDWHNIMQMIAAVVSRRPLPGHEPTPAVRSGRLCPAA
jgi:hypothetical protein